MTKVLLQPHILIQPDSEMQIMIRKELNEDVNTRDECLQHMLDWLTKQPHLPDTWDEHRIMTFLRGCKFSLEKCKRKLDMYFTMRTACPELFTNRNINHPEMKQLANYVNCPPLPGLTPNGRRAIIMRGLDKTIVNPPILEAMKLVLMIGDVRLDAEDTGVAGDVYIFDASIVTSALFTKITPSIVKKFLVIVQEAYPVKLKEVHVVNTSPLIETIITWVKPFLKEKIRERIHVHSTYETLYKFVPKDILPEEYGGTAGPCQKFHDEWLKVLEDYQPWFDAQESLNADESKRPGKPTNYDDLFGIDGSFKQLTID